MDVSGASVCECVCVWLKGKLSKKEKEAAGGGSANESVGKDGAGNAALAVLSPNGKKISCRE